MEYVLQAFVKLKKRDKIVIGVASFAVLAFLLTVFFLSIFNGFGIVKFPESAANSYQELQNRGVKSYPDLPTFIMFPETTTGMRVGGEEIGVLKDGTAFRFSEEAYIIASAVSPLDNTQDVIRERFYSFINGKEMEGECRYKHKISSNGYLNAEYLDYEGGIIKAPDGTEYYVLTYRQPSVEAAEPLMGVVTTDKKRLQSAMSLLNRMWNTMAHYEVVAKTEENSEEENATFVETSATTETSTKEEVLAQDAYNRDKQLAELDDERERMMHAISGEPKTISESIAVPKAMSEGEVVFYLKYTNAVNVPANVSLTDPDGNEEYEPYFYNDLRDGMITFEVKNPKAGTWKMTFENDVPLGFYRVACDEREVYEQMMYPPEGSYGREMD